MEHQSARNPLRGDQIYSEPINYGAVNNKHVDFKPNTPAMRPNASMDEFGDIELFNEKTNVNKIMRTGRQRKKVASRSKGGEFQQRRKKRRVYFCCVSNEIDIEQLHDNLDKLQCRKWITRMYEGVLHLSFTPPQGNCLFQNIINIEKQPGVDVRESEEYFQGSPDGYETSLGIYNSSAGFSDYHGSLPIISEDENPAKVRGFIDNRDPFEESLSRNVPRVNQEDRNNPNEIPMPSSLSRQQSYQGDEIDNQSASMLVLTGGKEVFVFDFGAVVFWGFKHGEEEEMLEQIRYHVVKDCLSKKEFEEGQDDMAFVTSPEADKITIANDVITLPDFASAKSRLSVSFAIAQSAVLAIFEARIEKKTEDYRYIPETLAARGKVRLSAKQLGGMIGEVYVIRHDVNLHSEILDTPDFFWKEAASVEDEYKLTMRYLEMENRTEILNKRLDMLRELLGVLQQQHENAHAMNVEWIVIWLIIVSVVLEVFAILTNVFS